MVSAYHVPNRDGSQINVDVIRFPRSAHARQRDGRSYCVEQAEEEAEAEFAPPCPGRPDGLAGQDEPRDPGSASHWPPRLNNPTHSPPRKPRIRTTKRVKGKRRPQSPVAVIADVLRARPKAPKPFQVTGLDPAKLLLEWFGAPTAAPIPAPPGRAETPAGKPMPDGGGEDDPDRRFWRIWISHYDHFFSLSLKLMNGNRADAEDALSTAMMKAHRAYCAGGIRNERAWLARLVRNACIDQYRQRTRHPETSYSGELDGWDDLGVAPVTAIAEYRTPEDALLAQEDLASFVGQLLELPETLLEPLMMRCLEERPYEEIARTLALSNAAVRKRIELARRRLKGMLG